MTSYKVGDTLDLSRLTVQGTSELGSSRSLSWSNAVAQGVTASPANDYVFQTADIGTKSISIFLPGGTPVTYDVTVAAAGEVESKAPARIALLDKETGSEVASVTLSSGAVENLGNGQNATGIYLTIPVDYGEYTKDSFDVKAYDLGRNEMKVNLHWAGNKVVQVTFMEYPDEEANPVATVMLRQGT